MKILITGAGTLAQALLRHMKPPWNPVLYCRSEYAAVRLHWAGSSVPVVLGDVRDDHRFPAALFEHSIEYVIHTAALKQVGSGAANVLESVSVNADGTANVVRWCKDHRTPMLFTSSDKAVEPLNTYGKAKAIAEDVVLTAGFNVTRWGNIIRSRGSVLERWERTRHIELTHADWTRFWLTRDEAAQFVVKELDRHFAFHSHSNPLSDGTVLVKQTRGMSMGQMAEAAKMAFGLAIDPEPTESAAGDKPHELLSVGHPTSQDVAQYEVQEMTAIIEEDMRRWPLT